MHAQSHSPRLHRQPRLSLKSNFFAVQWHNFWSSTQLTPVSLDRVAGVPSLMASPSQSLHFLGHYFDKITVADGARAHLGDVHGDYHHHVHHGEGEEQLAKAKPTILC
jgi:hypothetical protein